MAAKSPRIAWNGLSIRVRLTMGYAATLSLLLCVYAALVFAVIHKRFGAEIDHRLDQEVEVAERTLVKDAAGSLVWRPLPEGADGYQTLANVLWVDVHRPDGGLIKLFLGGYARGREPERLPFARRPSGFFSAQLPSGVALRVLQREVEVDGQRAIIRAAFEERQIEHELAPLLWVLALGLPLAVCAAAMGGYWLAGRALAPVARITEEARAITADRLHARLPVLNAKDELGRLATTFNEAFCRLENSFEQLRRFTADASHELRTPLAVMRSVGEVALRDPHGGASYPDAIGAMLEEVDRLTQLVQNLLTLARADSGRIVLARESFSLGELAEEAVSHLGVLAEEKEQQVDVAVAPVTVVGDRAVLRQAVLNLLDNAIKYSPPAGWIRISVQERADRAVLEVADSGPGIPAEHHDKVFDRFYRIDASRSRAEGGFGLGLAIARWAVEANGGRLEVGGHPGGGSVFRITLPSVAVQRAFSAT
jgi:heavy metal sensor kinase